MDLVETAERTKKIRALNDEFRKTFTGGSIVITEGLQDFHGSLDVLEEVKRFSAFSENNDPHGEHDFGAVEVHGEKFFWKIDYYAPDIQHGSEDPADPEKTTRVLTVMLASEY